MSDIKASAHALLESVLYNIARTGNGAPGVLVIPYYELAKDLGFGEKFYDLNIKLTIQAEFIDDHGVGNGQGQSSTKNSIRN